MVSLATFTMASSLEVTGSENDPNTPMPRLAELLLFRREYLSFIALTNTVAVLLPLLFGAQVTVKRTSICDCEFGWKLLCASMLEGCCTSRMYPCPKRIRRDASQASADVPGNAWEYTSGLLKSSSWILAPFL